MAAEVLPVSIARHHYFFGNKALLVKDLTGENLVFYSHAAARLFLFLLDNPSSFEVLVIQGYYS